MKNTVVLKWGEKKIVKIVDKSIIIRIQTEPLFVVL